MNKLNESLLKAARLRDFDGVQKAIENGADVNCLDDGGETAITASILYIWCGNAYFPLEDYVAMTKEQQDELERQNEQASMRIIQFLLDHGADIDLCADGGMNPLTASCHSQSPSIARLLLEHGANPNVNCWDGVEGEEHMYVYASSTMAWIYENLDVETPEDREIWDLCKEYGGKLYKKDMV